MALFKTGILGEVSGKLHGIEFAQQAGRCVLRSVNTCGWAQPTTEGKISFG